MADKVTIEIDLKKAKELSSKLDTFDCDTRKSLSTPEGECSIIIGVLTQVVKTFADYQNDTSWDNFFTRIDWVDTGDLIATVKNSTSSMGKKRKIKFNELGPVARGEGRGFDENNNEIWVEFLPGAEENCKCDDCRAVILDYGWQNIMTANCYCRNCVEVK
jgi:hypothetical protein